MHSVLCFTQPYLQMNNNYLQCDIYKQRMENLVIVKSSNKSHKILRTSAETHAIHRNNTHTTYLIILVLILILITGLIPVSENYHN